MPTCKTCEENCVTRVAKTEKNCGKKFWACPKGCKGWNGWAAEEEEEEKSQNEEKKKTSSKTPSKTSSKTSSKTPSKKQSKLSSKKKLTKKVYHCQRCDREIDLESEVDNHIRRYSRGGGCGFSAQLLRDEIYQELKEGMDDEEYTCEKCLGNEC